MKCCRNGRSSDTAGGQIFLQLMSNLLNRNIRLNIKKKLTTESVDKNPLTRRFADNCVNVHERLFQIYTQLPLKHKTNEIAIKQHKNEHYQQKYLRILPLLNLVE